MASGTLVKNCCHSGKVQGKSEEKPSAFEGAISGSGNIELNECKWYSETVSYAIGNPKVTDGFTLNLEMPSILTIINDKSAFKEDTNNINSGYPILSWQ